METRQIRMTYCYPDQLIQGHDDNRKACLVRQPNSPTRPARPYELGGWYVENPEPKPAIATNR